MRASSTKNLIVLALLAGVPAAANAAVTITNTGNTLFANTLTFDEPGGPVGTLPFTNPQFDPPQWLALGLTITSGEGTRVVDTFNTQPGFGWLGTGNALACPFGGFFHFNQPITEFSVQYWDTSGPGGPFGGGAIVQVDNGDPNAPLATFFVSNPAFGGVGQPGFTITTTGGSTFTDIRLVGFGFPADAYFDNVSWTVPTPGAATMLALGGVALLRRRRA